MVVHVQKVTQHRFAIRKIHKKKTKQKTKKVKREPAFKQKHQNAPENQETLQT